ncbi:hypothetical protein O9K51_10361 [Purpureocillium lavendulum]|uniref:Reverse transcriptase n=1 Tax=Purpureocillium lavendulum TaxID=1247861 RepID=A0AB34FCC7_9HYPO|nr:hypothetical protein O9K51_10361 [Purpureocillium lavendulum]
MEANNQDEGSPGRTTQMLMQMMIQMSEQLQNMQANQQTLRAEREADRDEMRTQIRNMQSAIATPTTTPQPQPPAPRVAGPEPRRSSSPENAPAKKKPTLPNPPKFDGTRRNFRPWYLEMRAKLLHDCGTFRNDQERFAYIYARLEGTAQNMAAAYFEQGGSNNSQSPDQFLDYLNRRYGDPNAKARALDRLRALRQRHDESFATFFPKFEKELADSGGGSWVDAVQINYLEGALNGKLKDRLISVPNLPTDFNSYAELLLTIGSRLDSRDYQARQERRNPTPTNQEAQPDRTARRESPDRMDWEATKGPRERPAGKPERSAGKPERPQQRTKTARIEPRKKGKQGQDDEAGSHRRQEHQQALKEWKEFEDQMDSPPMYVNIGINREHYSTVFVDSGCLCYGTINEAFARKLRLPRIPIKPRTLDEVITSLPGAIRSVTYADIDIDGYRKKRAFFYIIPGQDEDVILGRTWMNLEDVTIYPSRGLLHIGSQDHWVKERDPNRRERYELYGQSASTFAGLVRRARKETQERQEKPDPRRLRVFSASLADIEKALAPKKRSDARDRLPTHYHEYLSVFDRAQADRLPPHRPGSDHKILLEKDGNGKEEEPPWGPLYGMSREELIVLRRTLTELLDKGFIRASSSPASAPVLFVRKPGGGLRFCVDYRGLNAITKKDRYPLPLIEETLRSLSKAKWLTKLDVIAAFHKVRIEEGDEWKTAFRTRYGLYEWLVTPFGLTGAPATFQRYINHTLREFLDEFCSAYIDDILIYSSGSLADHRKKVKQVLARLRDAGLQIDIDKCEFEATSVKYLGFIVEAGKGIRVDPEKVRAIQEWQSPRSARAVRSFLGFANYYRQFIPKFSNIASPLTALTKKDAAFAWSNECQAAFEELKLRLISAPILAQWDPDRETVVETDSSGYVTGGALAQRSDDGLMRPVAFFSKKCTPAECNYPIHDKELLAIMRCLEHWDAELRSVESFTVLTDHLNLRYFTKKQPLSERQARWAEMLSRYNFTIVHRPGKDAAVPDALSRREQDMPHSAEDERLRGRRIQLLEPAKGGGLVTRVKSGYISKGDTDQPGDATAEQDESVENPFTEPEIQELWKEGLKQHNRYWLIRNAVQEGERRLPSQWGLPVMLSECSIDEGQRLCWRERIWVPNHEPLRTRLMQDTHDSALAGHPGRDMLKSLLARRFYWPGLDADARQFVRNCDACGRSNVWREKRRGLLKPLPVPERIWSELSIDFVTELPPTKSNGSTNMMVLTDRLSKSVVLESLKDITAETTARALMRNVLQHHGIPAAIVTDRGTQFTSRMWKRLCELLRIKQRLSTAWHPETDGATERANQEVERYIRIFTTYAQDDWDELLPAAAMALNNRTATSTGLTPFFFTHGYHLEPVQVKEALRPDGKSPVAKAEGIVRRFQEATEWAQAAMASAQERQEDNANTRRQPSDQYKPGDKVWLRLRNIRSKRPSKKLDWLAGKYTVLETVGSHACRLDTPPGVHNVFHVSLLRLAADDPLPSQTSDDYRPPAILTDDGELWEVEEICGHKKNFAQDIAKIEVGKNWPYSFVRRNRDKLGCTWFDGLDMARRKADSASRYKDYFELIRTKIAKYNILPCNTYNVDEKGFLLGVINRTKRVFSLNVKKQGKLLGAAQDGNRSWITFLACICQDMTSLPPFLIYQGKPGQVQDSWLTEFEPEHQSAFFTTSETGWTNHELGKEWLTSVFDRFTKAKARNGRDYRLLITDGHSSHVNMDFLEWCDQHRIIVAVFPPHSTHRLQPLDVSLFSPLSTAYTKQLIQWTAKTQGLINLSKREFWTLFWNAFAASFSVENIVSGWERTGLLPLDPEVVLSQITAKTRDDSDTGGDSAESLALQRPTARDLRRLVDKAVDHSSSDAGRSSRRLKSTLESLQSEVELLRYENQGLRETIIHEKQRRQRGKALKDYLFDRTDPNSAQIFSPAKVAQARVKKAEMEAQKKEEALRKEAQKIQRQQKAAEQKALALEKRRQKMTEMESKRQKKEARKQEREARRQVRQELERHSQEMACEMQHEQQAASEGAAGSIAGTGSTKQQRKSEGNNDSGAYNTCEKTVFGL